MNSLFLGRESVSLHHEIDVSFGQTEWLVWIIVDTAIIDIIYTLQCITKSLNNECANNGCCGGLPPITSFIHLFDCSTYDGLPIAVSNSPGDGESACDNEREIHQVNLAHLDNRKRHRIIIASQN